MEGLSIDVKKFASDASTFFNRARQFTEEQLGQGNLCWRRFPSGDFPPTILPTQMLKSRFLIRKF